MAKTTTRPRAAKARRRPPGELFADLANVQQASDARIRRLLHELHVHAEELTAQNDQLMRTQGELEQARARYAELYDFAPIGFLTVTRSGAINNINAAGSALLGLERAFAHGLPLASAIDSSQRRVLRRFLARAWDTGAGVTTTFEVHRKQPPPRLLCFTARAQGTGSAARLFTALVDVTDERRLATERADALGRVKGLIQQLVTVQEEERRRLALNLHDHIGQQITALRLALGNLRAAEPAARGRRIDGLEEMAARIDRDLDYLAWELRPAALDDVGLAAALDRFVKSWSAQHGITAEFHAVADEGERLATDIESNLYRIAQEALNNVAKHAGASRASVLLDRRGSDAFLIIEDNGRGFDLTRARTARSSHAGMGLVGIEERCALVGATLQLETAPGKGSTLFVRVPARTERLG